ASPATGQQPQDPVPTPPASVTSNGSTNLRPTHRLACVVALTGVALLLAAGDGRGAAGPPPRLADTHTCSGLTGFTCGTLTVPLDHAGRVPGGLQLAVAVAGNARAPRG